MAERRGHEGGLDVVELTESPEPHLYRREVIASMDPMDPFSLRQGADRLSTHDIVILQHEYGIWGPDMGRPVLEFVDRLETPLITTLHTVLPAPTPTQQEIVESLGRRSVFTVVPTQAALDRLCSHYDVEPDSVVVIPHGTDPFLRTVARYRRFSDKGNWGPPRLLTWGLIGPGKGLEWALRAVGILRNRHPDLMYTIAGRTHPKVLANEGEHYRRGLEDLAIQLGIEEQVRFIDAYVSPDLLRDLLTEATLVVVPYDSTEQIVSGVIVEAVAAMVPVVATEFPHALELAESGAVRTVPHRDPAAIAAAVTDLIESAGSRGRMLESQTAAAPELEWANVAARYERLVLDATDGSAAMSHVPTAS
jgi:glycosyltransferase involved in cell wall biosynthesis